METLLRKLYYGTDNPSCYGGVNNLYRAAKKQIPGIKINDVKNFLSKQETYTLHKPVRRRFPRNKIVTAGLDVDWQADLADLKSLKKYNGGYSYILVVVDVLSKYLWAEPMKNKTASETAKAMSKILTQGRLPWRLCTDRGKEFKGQQFQLLMDKYDITHFSATSPDVKAALAEIYVRHMKNKLYRFFTAAKTWRYLEILPRIVDAMNQSVCRTTGMAPADVNRDNAETVWQRLYGQETGKKPLFRFRVGDRVRITKEKHKLSKGYLPNFNPEIFLVDKVMTKRTPATYKLKDLAGEDIEGIFYEAELVKVVESGKEVREIEKVIKTQERNKDFMYFVKFKNEPVKNNKWVTESELVTTI